MSEDKERAQFEQYIASFGAGEEYTYLILQKNSFGDYPAQLVQGKWEGWQARAAIQPCRICGEVGRHNIPMHDVNYRATIPSTDVAPSAPESALAESVLAWWDDQAGEAPEFVNLAMQMQTVKFDKGVV